MAVLEVQTSHVEVLTLVVLFAHPFHTMSPVLSVLLTVVFVLAVHKFQVPVVEVAVLT